jgi:hypothetical protein
LPNVVIESRARARYPSTKSVSEARANTIAARMSPFVVCPSSATISTGTSRMRTTVRKFGQLSEAMP